MSTPQHDPREDAAPGFGHEDWRPARETRAS